MNRFSTPLARCLPLMTAVAMLVFSGCGKKEQTVALFPLINKEDLRIGGELYKTRCAICHGTPEKGNLPEFRPLSESAIVKGDTTQFATAILYNEGHRGKPGEPGFFEELDDTSIARIANFVKCEAGSKETPMRARTIQRVREIHKNVPGGAEPETIPPQSNGNTQTQLPDPATVQ